MDQTRFTVSASHGLLQVAQGGVALPICSYTSPAVARIDVSDGAISRRSLDRPARTGRVAAPVREPRGEKLHCRALLGLRVRCSRTPVIALSERLRGRARSARGSTRTRSRDCPTTAARSAAGRLRARTRRRPPRSGRCRSTRHRDWSRRSRSGGRRATAGRSRWHRAGGRGWEQRRRDVGVCPRVVRGEREDATPRLERLLETTLAEAHQAEPIVHRPQLGPERDRTPAGVNGVFEPALAFARACDPEQRLRATQV